MIYDAITPCQDLKNTVRYFRQASRDASKHPPNTTPYAIARSLSELTFASDGNIRESERLFVAVQGQTTQSDRIPAKVFYRSLGISLYTHAHPHLSKISASHPNREFLTVGTFLGDDPQRILKELKENSDNHDL